MPAAAIAGGLGVLGGIAGAQKDQKSQTSIGSQESRVEAAPMGEKEAGAQSTAYGAMTSLSDRLNALESSPVLLNLQKLMDEMGQAPSDARMAQANSTADAIFAPQQASLDQSFVDQRRQYSNTAAQMGRSMSDPILAAKLAQEQVRQQASLSANKGSFAAQEAINAPSRQFQNQMGGLMGLQGQAIQNRQAIYGLGSDFANTQMNYRLATATRTGNSYGNTTQESGGGFKGFMQGALGGASAGMMMAGGMGGGGQGMGNAGNIGNGSSMLNNAGARGFMMS